MESLTQHLPIPFQRIQQHLCSLSAYDAQPDYARIQALLDDLFILSGAPADTQYDWDLVAAAAADIDVTNDVNHNVQPMEIASTAATNAEPPIAPSQSATSLPEVRNQSSALWSHVPRPPVMEQPSKVSLLRYANATSDALCLTACGVDSGESDQSDDDSSNLMMNEYSRLSVDLLKTTRAKSRFLDHANEPHINRDKYATDWQTSLSYPLELKSIETKATNKKRFDFLLQRKSRSHDLSGAAVQPKESRSQAHPQRGA
jgi:hypothetical protein